MGRIACIVVADFPIAALMRANPALCGKPLATSPSLAPHSELTALSAQARALGVRPGMTIAQARSIVQDLVVMNRSTAAERTATGALADVAQSLSPLVEPGAGGCVWLDLAGLARLHGSEQEIAAELGRRVERVGMEAAVAVAANKQIAYLAARCGGLRIVAPGQEREFLDWLPLDVLDLNAASPSRDLETTLARWGLRRLGDLARLDPDAMGSRLGRRGVELIRIARGEEAAPLIPRHMAETFVEETELDYEIENLEALGFVMRPMLERLVERLAMRGTVAGGVTLSMDLGGRCRFSRRVALGAPSNDVRALLTLIALSLETSPPEAAIESIRIEIEPRHPRAAQTDMFLPPSPSPDRLETTIARLAALCGPENVGLLRPENSYRPEAVRLDKFDPPPAAPSELPSCASNVARLIVRAIRPAVEVEVLCDRGLPGFVRGPNLGARVVSIAGPWRREGEWWRHSMPAGHSFDPEHTRQCAPVGRDGDNNDQQRHSMPTGHSFDPRRYPRCAPVGRNGDGDRIPASNGEQIDSAPDAAGFHRDYYELALADGGVYRVFRDLASERWFLDGVYD